MAQQVQLDEQVQLAQLEYSGRTMAITYTGTALRGRSVRKK